MGLWNGSGGAHLEHLSLPDPLPETAASELRRLRPDASVEEMLEFAWHGCGASFRPLQVRAEFGRFLETVRCRRPRAILEIGTANGGSLMLLSRFAADDAVIVSVDLPGGILSYEDSRRALYALFARPGQRLHLLRRDSHQPGTLRKVAELLGGRPLDLLFIDGDHTYQGVRQDFAMYAPLVSAAGLVALHDIVPLRERPHWCEVDRFWQERKPRCPQMEIVEDWEQGWAGIGLVPGSIGGPGAVIEEPRPFAGPVP